MQYSRYRGIHAGLKRCSACGKVLSGHMKNCIRCDRPVSYRIRHSATRTFVFLLASLVLYIPANTLPMFVFEKMGSETSNTILGGIMVLFQNGMYGIGVIVFTASIIIPVFKIAGLGFLLLSTRSGFRGQIRHRARLYRFIEHIGRWSMLDIFVISVMLTLMNFSPFISIMIGWGTSAFGAVVILTMMAAISFDPRLLRDAVENRECKGDCIENGKS